jgi:serine/threonine-protein kinase
MDPPPRIGRYEVELLLGAGVLGRVFIASDPALGRRVAIKILRDDLPLSHENRRRLTERVRAEVRAAATLSHPAIVGVHDLGDDERVGLFVVFDLVHGPSLRERLARPLAEGGGPLSQSEVAGVARTLGAALAHAHAVGVVHGGITPENVFLPKTGAVLTDFGISSCAFARRGASEAEPGLGRLAFPKALGYAAPEVLAAGALRPFGEQFALAATLSEPRTGARAFPGADPETVTTRGRRRHAAPTSILPALHGFSHLDAILDRALAAEPRARFPSCDNFATLVASELEGESAYRLTPPPPSSVVPRATRRRQNGAVLLALAVIFVLAAIGRLHRPPATGTSAGASLRNVASAFATSLTSATSATSARPAVPAASHHQSAALAPPADAQPPPDVSILRAPGIDR